MGKEQSQGRGVLLPSMGKDWQLGSVLCCTGVCWKLLEAKAQLIDEHWGHGFALLWSPVLSSGLEML